MIQPGITTQADSLSQVATVRANGIHVIPYRGIVTGTRLTPLTHAQPTFKLNTHAKLWKENVAWIDVSLSIPLPDQITSSKEVFQSLYDTIAELEEVPVEDFSLLVPLDDREFVDSESLADEVESNAASPRDDQHRMQTHLTQRARKFVLESFFTNLKRSTNKWAFRGVHYP